MKTLLIATGLVGFAGVALGALGAHALQAELAAHNSTETWRTAAHYQLIHAVAALAVLAGGASLPAAVRRLWHRAAACWLFGVVAFSGSLYWLALGGPKWLGPVTPLGGIALLTGWGLVIAGAWKTSAD